MHPQHVGRFEIQSLISENERGSVFRAFDPELNRQVALKLLKSQSLYTLTSERTFSEMAGKLRELNHPAILPVYDFGDEDNHPFIVMPLMEGGSLEERLKKGALSPEETVELFTPIAEALDYAASQGVFHKDLKPSNILFDQHGAPFLADLGLMQIVDKLSAARAPQTNPNYISPEQVRNREPDARSQVYSLGALIYHALTGQPLFSGASDMVTAFKHISEHAHPPEQIRPGISKAVGDVVMKAVEKKPEDRFQNARELLHWLDRAKGGAISPEALEQLTHPRPGVTAPRPGQGAEVAPVDTVPPAASQPAPGRGRTFTLSLLFVAVGAIVACAIAGVAGLTLFSTSSSIASTPTPDLAATQSVQSTQTAYDENLRQGAGWPVLLSESFDENTNDWSEDEENSEYANISWNINGQYIWTAHANQGFVWRVWPSIDDASDFYLTSKGQRLDGPLDAQYGVIFRNNENTDDYYLFDLTDEQEYSFWVHLDGEWSAIIDGTFSELITPGGQNQIEILAEGTRFTFYINGQFVNEAFDDRLSSGTLGLEIGMNTEGDEAVFAFDDFEVRVP